VQVTRTEKGVSAAPAPLIEHMDADVAAIAARGDHRLDEDRPPSSRGEAAPRHENTTSTSPLPVEREVDGAGVPLPVLIKATNRKTPRKPWVIDDSVQVRKILNLTVAFNHDAIDGVPARRFMQDLVSQIAKG
jgi:hypothetical protein